MSPPVTAMLDRALRLLSLDADLLAVSAATVLAPLAILVWPDSPVRAAVGLAVVAVAPGYAAAAAALPDRPWWWPRSETGSPPRRLGIAARLALSVGLSVAVVALLTLALSYASLSVRLRWILPGLAGLTVGASLLARWRRGKP